MKAIRTLIVPLILLTACSEKLTNNSTSLSSSTAALPGQSEPAARIIFSASDFTNLNQFVSSQTTSHQCLGDVLKVYYANGDDFMSLNGGATQFPAQSVTDSLLPTNRPLFIKNVSVDITNTYFAITQDNVVATDQCSYRGIASMPGPAPCADFDVAPTPAPDPTIAPTVTPSPTPIASATPTTTAYYGTGFFHVRDDWCTGQGPIADPDPDATKEGVGGVSIDLDRTQLGANEDLLMLITYHSFYQTTDDTGDSSDTSHNDYSKYNWPASLGDAVSAGTATGQGINDTTILQINLIGTAASLNSLLSTQQPRSFTYSNLNSYPIYVKQIATLQDPYGSLRTEQVYIPLAQNGLIDRIRIERIRGSYHLFQVDLYRLGNR